VRDVDVQRDGSSGIIMSFLAPQSGMHHATFLSSGDSSLGMKDTADIRSVDKASTSSESSASNSSNPIPKFDTSGRSELEELSAFSPGQSLAKCPVSLHMKHLPRAISSAFSSSFIINFGFANGLGVNREPDIPREEARLPNMALFELRDFEDPKCPSSLGGWDFSVELQ